MVPRLSDLTPTEVTDLFLTVQRVSRTVERVFQATSLNIAIQDGADAGQSVPHVHAHIIPRHRGDLDSVGGNDKIYEMLEGEDGDLGRSLRERDGVARSRFPKPDADEDRKPRSKEEMDKEAAWLAEEIEKDGADSKA